MATKGKTKKAAGNCAANGYGLAIENQTLRERLAAHESHYSGIAARLDALTVEVAGLREGLARRSRDVAFTEAVGQICEQSKFWEQLIKDLAK